MKLVRYGTRGAERPGTIDTDGKLRDLSAHVTDIAGDVLVDLGKISAINPASLPLVAGTPRRLRRPDRQIHLHRSVLLRPRRRVRHGRAARTGDLRQIHLCRLRPNDDIVIPRGAEKTFWEVEIAFVIGKPGKYIAEADAMDHVAGFCVCNDVSERAYQTEWFGQWSKGKSSDNFGPIGPWLVTRDEVANPNDLHMWRKVNGAQMQNGSTKTMVDQVPYLVAYLSQFFTLHPGDVISTGTPPGVGLGMKPPRSLKAGDVVKLGIEGLGEQRQICVNDA